MAELGSFKVVVERLKDQRERVVILVLLLVLAWLSWNAWSTLQEQKSDEEGVRRRILIEHGYDQRGPQQIADDDLDPKKVTEHVIEIPPEDNLVRPLIEVDPLRPREDINEIRRQIGIMMERASILMSQRKWADAIEVFDEILEIDPAGVKYEYREGTPRELRAEAEREQTRSRMVQANAEADEEYESGNEELEQGNDLQARDLLIQARRDYGQILDMDPDRRILDEAFYANIDARIEDLTSKINDLVMITLGKDIASKREKAEKELAAYRQDPKDIDSLASAKETLIESLDIVDSVDPERNIVRGAQVEEIASMLEEVESEIVEVVPALVEDAQEKITAFENAQNPQEKILRGEAALDAVGLLRRVRDDPNSQQIYSRIEQQLEEVRRSVAVERANEILAEARRQFERAQEAVRRSDMGEAASRKEEALASLAELRTLPEEEIRDALVEAEALRREINVEIRSMPMVAGVEIDEIDPDGKWVRLSSSRETWSGKRHILGSPHPLTSITVTEIEPNPADGNPYVVVRRPNRMETKITMEEETSGG
jgi:hypothetical protein